MLWFQRFSKDLLDCSVVGVKISLVSVLCQEQPDFGMVKNVCNRLEFDSGITPRGHYIFFNLFGRVQNNK